MTLDDIALYEGPLPYAIAQYATYVTVLTSERAMTVEQGTGVDPDQMELTDNQKSALYVRIYDPINQELLGQARDINVQRKLENLPPIRIIADWRSNRFHFSKHELRNDGREPQHERRLHTVVQAIAYAIPDGNRQSTAGFSPNGDVTPPRQGLTVPHVAP